jgi:spermidine synthase
MGFTSLVVQVLLIREFLISFYGNELIIGLILGNWIALEAIGSYLASRPSQRVKKPILSYCILQCLIAMYLPCAIYLIRAIRDFMSLAPGEGISLIPVFVSSFLILAPLSIFDGAQFPFGCRIWRDHTKKDIESAGNVYIFEAIGFVIAGPIFTYLLITKLHSFQIAIFIGILNLLSGFFILQKEAGFYFKKVFNIIIIILSVTFTFVLFSGMSDSLNNLSLKKQWPGYNLLESKNSIYGNIAVTKEKEQYTFFSDGIPIITAPVPDIISNEEFIHFGMLSHPGPRDVLIIGGGAGGPISEILKYPVKHLDYAELDPLLIQLIKNYPTYLTQNEFNDPRLSVKISDGARYIKKTPEKYDIVFVNLPAPATLQLNRFYTREFFGLTKKVLREKQGIFIFRLPGSLSYLNLELKKLNLSILNTLKDVFTHVKIIPGESNIYLASSSDFNVNSSSFVERLNKQKVPTRLLTPFQIEYRLNERLVKWFNLSLSDVKNVKENTTFLPTGTFYSVSYWNSLFSPALNKLFRLIETINLKTIIFMVILLVVFLILFSSTFTRFKKIYIPYAIFTTGLLGISYELIIIFTYQSFYGYVYHHIALLITSFMSGLTLGGWLVTKRLSMIKNKKIKLILIEAALIIFSLAVAPLFIYLGAFEANLSFVFFIVSAISGFLVGSEFPLANYLYRNKNLEQAGTIYAFDLMGSWIGAIAVSIVLIPVLGLVPTCIFLAALKMSSLILINVLG